MSIRSATSSSAVVQLLVVVLASVTLLALGGCSSGPESTPPRASEAVKSAASDGSDYVFVWLKTGPKSADHSKEERTEIMKGHLANIHRLVDEKKLIIAGPFGRAKHDPEDRGVFVFDVSSVEEARRLVDTDPGVQAGEFRPLVVPMRSSPTLRRSLELEEALESKAKSEGREVGMEDMRTYVLVTVKEMSRAEPELPALEAEGVVVFSGRFGGDIDGWGVIVMDATDVHAAVAALGPALGKMGECWLDPWHASKSLEGLRDLRRGR